MFNCNQFHWLQWCLLFKVIKNWPWNPDEAHMDRRHPAGGLHEPRLTWAYKMQAYASNIAAGFPFLINGDQVNTVRPVLCNSVFTLRWDEWCHRSQVLYWLQRQIHLDGGMCSVQTQVQSNESRSHSVRGYRQNRLVPLRTPLETLSDSWPMWRPTSIVTLEYVARFIFFIHNGKQIFYLKKWFKDTLLKKTTDSHCKTSDLSF